jgi:lysyl-tRNA synthetase class 1
VDEYDDVSAPNRDARAAELAGMAGVAPIGIPFKHLVNLVQITEGDVEKICTILRRHHLPEPERTRLQRRIDYARYWLEHFSPPEARLQLQPTLPAAVAQLTAEQRQALGTLSQRLQPEMDGDTIHTLVYTLAEESGLAARALFEAIYIALLGQSRGPRVGWFLSSLDMDVVRTRFQEAATWEEAA